MNRTVLMLPAYTLIEVLAVISIIGLASTIILFDYSGERATKDLDNDARELVAVVRGVQNDALTGRQYVSATKPCWYRVTWASGPTYTVTYQYKDASDSCVLSSSANYTLKNSVVFNNGGSVDFTSPHAQTSAATIELAKSGSSVVVCVYDNGLINNTTGSSCPAL